MNRPLLSIAIFAIIIPNFVAAGDLVSPAVAERLGLVESWHRQLGTVGGAASIVDMQVWVQHNKEREYVEIVRADKEGNAVNGSEVLRRISTDMKNASGLEIGKKEAERLAYLDVLKLKRRGLEVVTQAKVIKQIRLYLLGSDGGLSAYDAETGELLWTVQIGKPHLGYGTLGIADGYVTVINGTTMYRVIADERKLENSIALGGRPLKAVHLDNIPIIGASNTNSVIAIPNTRSGIECYSYESEPAQPSFEMFSGQALSKPMRYPTSSKISWSTDRGFVYVMETDGTPSTLFRLGTDGNVAGGIAPASDDRFFFGSAGGRVYGIRASRSGEVLWNHSFGEPFYHVPYVSGEHVLIASSYGNLFCLSTKDGKQVWGAPAPNIDQVFGRAGNYYFARTAPGMLAILSPDSGQEIAIGERVFVDHVVNNSDTDRVYLVSNGGTVQCLRPAASELPVFLRDLSAPVSTEAVEQNKKPEKKEASNPFGVADTKAAGDAPVADPFGAGGETPEADPFGGGADPFGAAAGGAAADPFGN